MTYDIWRPGAFLALVTLGLAACSGPQPTAELRSAGDAIARAQYDGAQQLAPQPLQMAQGKLSSAHSAANKDDMDQAKWLAEESEADANYAAATANAQRIGNTASELTGAQRRLQQPLQRSP
jgi:hypothetical protein